jgi:hypothetical protein
MEKNKTIILVVVCIVIICVAGIIFLNTGVDTDYKNNGNTANKTEPDNGAYLIEDRDTKYKQTEITPNMKPYFKVGETFVYEQTGNGGDPESGAIERMKFIFKVEGIERINKTDYYIVSHVGNSSFFFKGSKGEPHSIEQTWVFKHYISVETGKFLKTNAEFYVTRDGFVSPKEIDEVIVPENKQLTYNLMVIYYLWMLSLDENFKIETTDEKGVMKDEFEFIGTDTLNGRECFKVKKRTTNIRTNEVLSIDNMWVDKQRRILLKSEHYEDRIKMSEIELVSTIN